MRMFRSLVLAVSLLTSVLVGTSAPNAAALSSVVGWLDPGWISVSADNSINVSGWALTSDYSTAALGVRIRVDCCSYYFPATNYRVANLYRPAVGAAYLAGSTSTGRFFGRLWSQFQGLAIGVTYSRGSTYQADIDIGATAWNPGTSNLEMLQVPIGSAQVQVIVGNYNSTIGSGNSGITGFGGSCPNISSPCTSIPICCAVYSANTVWLNSGNSILTTDLAQRRKVVSHEIGHSIGLAHPSSPGVPTVMTQGLIGGNVAGSPQIVDQGSINNAYI